MRCIGYLKWLGSYLIPLPNINFSYGELDPLFTTFFFKAKDVPVFPCPRANATLLLPKRLHRRGEGWGKGKAPGV
jgi:hypothetical protein